MNDWIDFTAYRRERAPAYSPVVTIMTSGAIGFSSSFMRTFNLRDYSYVAFRFAEDNSYYYLGFSFSKVGTLEESAKIYRPKGKDTAIVSGKGFLNYYGIVPAKYKGRYVASERGDSKFGKMLVVKIKK